MSIVVQNITKKFGDFTALNDISLEFPRGELVALLGPSGSGKTSLLRIIAGLESADHGSVFFHGEEATHKKVGERQVGFVFQHYALFRHMTVFQNVAFGLEVKAKQERLPRAKINAKVHQLLQLVQMDWMADRYPAQLSGGQRQRIALARALAVEPKVLLLDEPFGALDAKVRKELRRWIRRLHDEIHLTSIFVTHDQEEALEVADRVVVMNEGRIEQIGAPEEVYDHPKNLFVYQFLGDVNLFRGRLNEATGNIPPQALLQRDGPENANLDSDVFYARPCELEIHRQPTGPNAIAAIVNHVRAIGPIVKIELKSLENGEFIEAELAKDQYRKLAVGRGEQVYIQVQNARCFPAQGE
ncbi:MAG: sulfate ABC transporter ATP-binding protein [Bacillota bacterium]|jgi:sulfate transport system ATP-binding protein